MCSNQMLKKSLVPRLTTRTSIITRHYKLWTFVFDDTHPRRSYIYFIHIKHWKGSTHFFVFVSSTKFFLHWHPGARNLHDNLLCPSFISAIWSILNELTFWFLFKVSQVSGHIGPKNRNSFPSLQSVGMDAQEGRENASAEMKQVREIVWKEGAN